MKKICFLIVSLILGLGLQAQFTGCFAPSNWTQNTSNTNGTILFQQNGSLSMLADTDGTGNGSGVGLDCSSNGQSNVSVCISAPGTGQIGFTWSWSGGNQASFTSEPFGYCINGTPFDLTSPGNGGGTESVPITQGDTFCLVVSTDNAASHFTVPTSIFVSNFSGPCTSTGIEEQGGKQELNIYPNPSEGQFVLELDEDLSQESLLLSVVNALGQIVHQESRTVAGKRLEMDLSFLARGSYVLQVQGKEQVHQAAFVLN